MPTIKAIVRKCGFQQISYQFVEKHNFAHFGACYASKNWKLMLPNLQKINQNCVDC